MATAVILAGGQSRRFGRDKAFFQVGRRPMIDLVMGALQSDFDDIIVAGGDVARFREHGLVCHPDPVAGRGALGGIYNGLVHSQSDWFFCCGCDMPLLKPAVIRAIVTEIGGEDLLLPVIGDIRQPLHAVYRRTILLTVERLLGEVGQYLPDLFGHIKVRHLEERLFSHIPDYHLSFVSLDSTQAVSQYRSHLDNL